MPADQPDQTDMSQNRMDPGAPAIAEHRYTRKAAISGGFHSWSCGELNPGPMTVPSVFYVRSLLAKMAIFSAPNDVADNCWRAYLQYESPTSPVAQLVEQVF